MKRNIQLPLILSIVILLSAIDASTQKPNIILILADDVGYHSVGCNGSTSFSTPRIDQMAAEGTRYTQCHSAPLCSPSRFMLLTGKYNFRNFTDGGNMSPGEKTLGNMLQDAGYQTAVYGKWQLNGGDNSIKAFGFKQYCVFGPFEPKDDILDTGIKKLRYKNPVLYTNAAYMDSNLTKGRYGEDILTDSVLSFIEKNKSNPFFIYYPMLLSHAPFSPTPDNPEFEGWDPNKAEDDADTVFYPSMIKYMDKKVGQIIDKVKSLGLEGKTYIFFTTDNGTPKEITESYNGISAPGGKNSTTESGTLVPLIAWLPGKVSANRVCDGLIDFTDFMPTLAVTAGINTPTTYGILDGKSFAGSFRNPSATLKPEIFTFFDRRTQNYRDRRLEKWVQNKNYKIYDTTASDSVTLFFNILTDRNEKNPLSNAALTIKEKIIKQQLLSVMDGYKKQGYSLFDTPAIEKEITPGNIIVTSSVTKDGGNFITERGIIYDTVSNALKGESNFIANGQDFGTFSNHLVLDSNKNYFIRTYAVNYAGIAYSPEVKLFYKKPSPPNEIAAFDIRTSRFTIKWSPQLFADGYQVDVSRFPDFYSPFQTDTLYQGFINGLREPPGWTFSDSVEKKTGVFGLATPSLQLTDSADFISTTILPTPAVSLSFWSDTKNNSSCKLLVEALSNGTWIKLDTFTQTEEPYISFYNKNSPGWKNNFVSFRFTNITKGSYVDFDDVTIRYKKYSFQGIYDSLFTQDSFVVIRGLAQNTRYFYRIRTVSHGLLSENSATSFARTLKNSISSLNEVSAIPKKLQANVSPNPANNYFVVKL